MTAKPYRERTPNSDRWIWLSEKEYKEIQSLISPEAEAVDDSMRLTRLIQILGRHL